MVQMDLGVASEILEEQEIDTIVIGDGQQNVVVCLVHIWPFLINETITFHANLFQNIWLTTLKQRENGLQLNGTLWSEHLRL